MGNQVSEMEGKLERFISYIQKCSKRAWDRLQTQISSSPLHLNKPAQADFQFPLADFLEGFFTNRINFHA